MATLNDLRTKGGLIVTIVVAFAMLAFILSDLINSGSSIINERKTRVGVIDGNNVNYQGFYNRVENLQEVFRMLWGTNSFTNEQYDAVYDAVWQEYISENIYQPGFKKLGLNLSQKEKVDMINGTYVSPVLSTIFADPTTGQFSEDMVLSFMSVVDANPQYQAVWEYLKEQMAQERQSSNYMSLVSAAFVPNDIEVNRQVASSNKGVSGKAVSQYFETIADSLIMDRISDADVKAYYNSHKDAFRQTSGRVVDYVVFDVIPSEQDYADAAEAVNQIAAEFAETDAPMQYATVNSQSQVDESYYSEDLISPEYLSYAFGENVGQVYGPTLVGDTYTIARISDVRNLPDSLKASHILLSAENEPKADSILNLLNNGAVFADLANEFSIDSVANADGGNLGEFAPEQMVKEFSDACLAAKVGDIFTVTTSYGKHIVKLTGKSAERPKAQVAVITYQVDPSEETQQAAYSKASSFLTEAGSKFDGFRTAATNQSLAPLQASLTAANHTIANFENPRELVRWAFGAKQGDVSSIFDIDNKYVVASVESVVEEGYAPLKEVAALASQAVKNKAKAEYFAEQVKDLSVEQAAQKLGLNVTDIQEAQFSSYMITGLGIEPKLIGAVSASQRGDKGVVEGVSSAIMYQIDDVAAYEEGNFDDAKVYLESYATYYLDSRLEQAVLEQCDIVDNRAKYF